MGMGGMRLAFSMGNWATIVSLANDNELKEFEEVGNVKNALFFWIGPHVFYCILKIDWCAWCANVNWAVFKDWKFEC